MKRITSILLSLLSIFPCCADKQPAPTLPLTRISYRYGSQMIRYPSTDMTFFTENDSVFAIVFDIEEIKYRRYLIKQEGLMQELNDIFLENKMYKYKSSYNDPNVLDGDGWSFNAKFSGLDEQGKKQKLSISSGGSNAWPKGNGLSLIRDAMKRALEGAQYLFVCDEEGHEIPDVPLDARMASHEDCDYIYANYREYYSCYEIRFHDLDTNENYLKIYGDYRPENIDYDIKTRAEKSYGFRIYNVNGQLIIYLIVEQGAVESIPLDDLVKGKDQTTSFSVTQGLTDVVIVDGKPMGIDKQGETVEIIWE